MMYKEINEVLNFVQHKLINNVVCCYEYDRIKDLMIGVKSFTIEFYDDTYDNFTKYFNDIDSVEQLASNFQIAVPINYNDIKK